MSQEQTLSIIKPDGVKKHLIGTILSMLEKGGLRIVAQKMIHLSQQDAARFYAIHKSKPFFTDLITFMSSGPVVVSVLEGDNAITKNRDIMGATNPKEAAKGSIRNLFSESIDRNTVHGSDGEQTAREEILFFFTDKEIFS